MGYKVNIKFYLKSKNTLLKRGEDDFLKDEILNDKFESWLEAEQTLSKIKQLISKPT